MWWNPSISLNEGFLEIVPTLDYAAFADYPISVKNIRELANLAVDADNLSAYLGALLVWFSKKEESELNGDFEIVNLANLDRCLYLMSQPAIGKERQYLLQWLARQIFQKWFESATKQKILDFHCSLKEEIKWFQVSSQLTDRSKIVQQTRKIVETILLTFQNIMEDSKTKEDHEWFQNRFKEHAKYIIINHKQMFVFNLIQDIQFTLVRFVNQKHENSNPKELIELLASHLFIVSTTLRLSFSIQYMAFIMKKILILHRVIPSSQYKEFIDIIYQTISIYQLSNYNLAERVNYFSFHMLHNHYFFYLEELFTFNGLKEIKKIIKWKAALREAIEESIPAKKKQISAEDIDQAMFYLQLRNKGESLTSKEEKVQLFPDISSPVLSRVFVHPILKGCFSSSKISLSFYNKLKKSFGQIKNRYKQFNIVEKGVFFYHLCYLKALKFHKDLSRQKIEEIGKISNEFRQFLPNESVFELLEFFLFKIQLGNYYNVEYLKDPLHFNRTNNIIYTDFIDIIGQRIMNFLNNFKSICSTKELSQLNTLSKYFSILVQSLIFRDQPIFVCPFCKKIEHVQTCPYCEEIALGIQLKADNQNLIHENANNKNFYEKLVHKINQLNRAALKQVLRCRKQSPQQYEWLLMLEATLFQMIRMIKC